MNSDFCPLNKGLLSGLGESACLGLKGAVFPNLCEWRQERGPYPFTFLLAGPKYLTEATSGMEEGLIQTHGLKAVSSTRHSKGKHGGVDGSRSVCLGLLTSLQTGSGAHL